MLIFLINLIAQHVSFIDTYNRIKKNTICSVIFFGMDLS